MILRNDLEHMRNQSILVNGHTYKMDGDGVARDVEQDDAKKLLGNARGCWHVVPESPKEKPKAGRKAVVRTPVEQPDGDE